MIQYILLQNRQGKTRLSKYYRPYTDEEKVKLESEIHRLVTTRDPKFTNFVEVREMSFYAPRFARAEHDQRQGRLHPALPSLVAHQRRSIPPDASSCGLRGLAHDMHPFPYFPTGI